METKKLSRTVQRRLNRKLRLQSNQVSAEGNSSESLTRTVAITKKQSKEKKKQKKVIAAIESETDTNPTLSTVTMTNEIKTESEPMVTQISKRSQKRNPENKVVYINSSYGRNDASGVGGLIQAGLVDLRNQSRNIKTASDLTESQAHVVKRQITRLQGAHKNERVFKRPKHLNKTIGQAAKELLLIVEQQKTKLVENNKSTKRC